MKKLIIYSLILISISCNTSNKYNTTEITPYRGILLDTALDTNRIWRASDFGIYPDKDTCYTDIMQTLVDISYTLPGYTKIEFSKGTYHFDIYFDYTKYRHTQWVHFIISNNDYGALTFSNCDK